MRNCGLCKLTTETPTNYVSNVTENKYEYEKYHSAKPKRGKLELPINEYPYSIEYKIEKKFITCRQHKD